MVEDSAEYSTLIDLTSELRLALRSELFSLTGSLLAMRLISPETDNELRNTIHSEVERSARLVELVQNKVRQSSRHYHAFIGILQGNQDQYGDILEQLEHTYQERKQKDDTNDDSADVKSEISQLERQFRLLHGMILSEMEDKHLVVSELLHSLTLLPTEIRIEYKTAITEMFPDLRRESTISDLFYHLSPLVDFLSYGLLKYIIDEFGSATLKTRMLSYSEKVLVFMKNTTVKQLMDHWPGQQEVPPNFSKLRARIGGDPSVYTLYELDRLRRRFCSGVKLTDIVLAIIGLEMANSFIAEWLIPSVLVPQLMESIRGVDDGFYLQEYILMMLVNEEQVFPYQDFSKGSITWMKGTMQLSDQPIITSVEQGLLTQQHEVHKIRTQLVDCALYSGVGVTYNDPYIMNILSEVEFAVISSDFSSINHETFFTTVAQSMAYPPTATESSDLPNFVIAVFVSGDAGDSVGTLLTDYGSVNIVDDIIKPFLPQSAPHLQHIPKLFFISLNVSSCLATKPPHFPHDRNGNFYVAYHTCHPYYMGEWMWHIADHLFRFGVSVQEVVESSRSCLYQGHEYLYYLSYLEGKLVLVN